MRMPEVSIIIPNYNQTRFIQVAIESVLEQTVRPFEIIIVDDGSTDNSREVVAKFGVQVRYIWQENQGLAGARNTGIRAAGGEWIGLLDADDIWTPNYLENMLALAENHPGAAVYYCQARCIDVDGNKLRRIVGGPAIPPDKLYSTILRANFLIPSTTLMRRPVILEAGLFDPDLRSLEDFDLWLRILRNLPECKFIGTNNCLVHYRLHGSSLSGNPIGMQQAIRKVIEKHFGFDDGKPQTWSSEKQRAFGGVYRFHALSSIQRQNDWKSGARYMRLALGADPTLAKDLDLFYELSFGGQPLSYRGTSHELDMVQNARRISRLLIEIFESPFPTNLGFLRRQTFGTGYLGLGIVAYNTGHRSLCQKYLMNALYYRPDLWSDRRIWGNLFKSLIRQNYLEKLKKP